MALGLLLLAAGSFLPWYEAPDANVTQTLQQISADATIDPSAAAVQMDMWNLTVVPWIAAIGFVLGGFVLISTLFGRTSRQAILWSVPAAWFGLLLTMVIAVRVFDAPVDGARNRYGIYVGLAGAVLIWLGGWQSMRDERAVPAFELSPEPEIITREQLDERATAIGRGDAA